jgi:hypothetical protein
VNGCYNAGRRINLPTDQMIRPTRVAVFAILSIASPLHAQAPGSQPTFRGGPDLVVQVDVSVLDGKRQPIRGLKAEDFIIFEDGQRREIQAFTEVNLPDRFNRVVRRGCAKCPMT